VLTARHCVVDQSGAAKAAAFHVTYAAPGARGETWTTVPARIVAAGASEAPMPPQSPPPSRATGPWKWLPSDWALLQADSADPIDAIPMLDEDPARVVPADDAVELVSCLDTGEPRLRCHVHPFAFGERPRELIEGGHSGAPILWRGKLIATFT